MRNFGYFVVGEKEGRHVALARCDSEEEAEDRAAGDDWDRFYIAEIVQVVG